MIKRIILSFAILSSVSNFAIAQRLVKLNMLEKSPLSNMVVYSTNDSTARYTKLLAGTGIQINYNEGDTTLTIIATGTSVGVPQELSLNDATRELSITDGNTVDLSESIQDEVATLLQAGSNVTLTYDDGAGTLTIAATGGGGATNLGDLGDVTITSATTGQVLKYDGAEWINAADNGIALTDLSVTTNAAGSAALSYNNTNGIFTYTPPDLSSYLTSAQLANLTDIDTAGLQDSYILKYNSSTQEWEVIENNIDGLTDGYYKNGNLGLPKTDTIIDYNQTVLGWGTISTLVSGGGNTTLGAETMRFSSNASQNTVIGRQAGKKLNGSDNVLVGKEAGYISTGSQTELTLDFTDGVFLGQAAWAKDTISTNEIVIGSKAVGNGSNTATLGNNNITATYLKGTTNLSGYGAGNKEAADLTKTRSAYIAAFATDGTLLELDTTGLFGGGGSGTPQTLSFSESTRELTISDGNTVDLSEGIQDEIAATITAGTGITVTYDDGAGTLEIAAPAGSGNTDEQTLSINEATAELTISNGNTVDLSELIDEQVNTLLTAGDNIGLTYNDVANTLTISASGDITNIDQIDFNANTADVVEGRLQYDTEFGTLVFGLNNDTPLHIGSDMGWYVKNQTGSDIAAGTPVYASGTDGASGRITVAPMIADGSINAKYFLGVTAEAIVNGADGFVWTHGKIRGINLSGYSAGDVLYVSSASAGAFVNTSPSAPNLKLPVGFVVNNTSNGTLAVRSTIGTYLSESHDVQIASASNGEVLKFDGSKWVDGTDLVDDADADPNNEIQTITASNGLTATATGDDYDVKLGGSLSDATTTIDMNDNALTFTNNGSFTLSGDGGVSFTNTSATDYSSVLSLGGTNTRIYADGGTTEPLNSINLTSSRSGVKEMDIRSSVSNDNGTYTLIALNPTRLSIKTPNVTDVTAQNGQFLKLVDRLTGEVEFDDIIDLTSLSVTTNSAGTAALSYNNTNGVFTYTPPDLSGYLTSEVDGSVTNEIQDLSLSENTLSLSGDATTVDLSGYLDNTDAQAISLASNTLSITGNASTVDLSGYLDDQTVSLTGAGITAITGTYPSFTITSTEVDGSLTNEGQLSASTLISGTTARLTSNTGGGSNVDYVAGTGLAVGSSGGNTITYTNTLPEATTASNGLTETGNDIKLGGTLSGTTLIDIESNNFYINDDGATQTGIAIIPALQEVNITGKISGDTELQMTAYGLGNKEASDLSLTGSAYLASFATDGTLIEYPISSISGESTTASNGLTLSGSDVKLGGTLSEITNISMAGFNASIYDVSSNTGFAIQPSSNLIVNYGTQAFDDYGSGNKEAADLSKTKSNYKAAFATDGTLIEYDDIDAMVVACSDETTDITTGTAKATFRAPHAMTITGVRASLTTASSSGTVTIDINEDISGGGASILGTKLTIDANEKTSTTAATAATITDTAIADDAEITIDIDAAGTGATGLKVTILYRKN